MAETTEQYRTRMNQIKKSVEEEPAIRKMRDDIAEGLGKTGNRQADIEDQFQSVIDGTTGKDVISAPEILAARTNVNGTRFPSLKAKNDAFEQETENQLSQIELNGRQMQSLLELLQQQVTSMGDISPRPYSTLSDLKYAHPNGGNGVYVVSSTGKWYWYNYDISDWVIGGDYQVAKIADGTITLKQTRFAEIISRNEFDPSTAIRGALGTLGTVIENTNFYTSDFKEAKEGEVWEFSHTLQCYAFYNSAGQTVSAVTNAAIKKITIPAGVTSYKVSFYFENLSAFMMSKKGLPSSYEIIKYAIKGDHLYDIEGSKIRSKSISQDKTDFFEDGINLLKDVSAGFYLNNGGVLTANPVYSTSGYVEVKAGETIIPTYQRTATFFKTDKSFNSEVLETSIPKNKALIAPIDGFFRVSYPTSESATMMITKGTTVPDKYQKSGKKIPNLIVEANQVIGLETVLEETVLVNLPSKMYASVGHKFLIYDDNILKEKSENYNIRYTSSFGAKYDGRFESTPTVAGTHPITVEIYDKSKLVATKTVDVIITSPRTSPTKVLFIGDSTISPGKLTQILLDKLGSYLQLIGTRGTGLNLHEGRPGWTFAKLRTGESFEGKVNPFYNPTTGDYDFNYYMTQNGFSGVKVVVFQYGINDGFSYRSDEAMKSASTTILANMTYLRNSILAYDPTIKVVFNLPIPPNAKQQKFAEQKLASPDIDQNNWRVKYNNFILVNEMIKRFNGVTDLVSIHASIDTHNNIADHVHPDDIGYSQLADVDYYYLNSL